MTPNSSDFIDVAQMMVASSKPERTLVLAVAPALDILLCHPVRLKQLRVMEREAVCS